MLGEEARVVRAGICSDGEVSSSAATMDKAPVGRNTSGIDDECSGMGNQESKSTQQGAHEHIPASPNSASKYKSIPYIQQISLKKKVQACSHSNHIFEKHPHLSYRNLDRVQ